MLLDNNLELVSNLVSWIRLSHYDTMASPCDHTKWPVRPPRHRYYMSPPVRWGFTTAHDRERLERLIGRLWRGDFLPVQVRSLGDLDAEADRSLFRALKASDPCHVLGRLLPEVKSTSYNLQPPAHCFILPPKDKVPQFHPMHAVTCNFMIMTSVMFIKCTIMSPVSCWVFTMPPGGNLPFKHNWRCHVLEYKT